MTPGLANKLCAKYATKICCNFPETVSTLPDGKGILTGSPIRKELLSGDKVAGLKLCNFNTSKPVLMVIGGSLGALHVNEAIREILPELLRKYQVIHVCGKGKVDPTFYSTTGYYQFEYVNAELKDLFAAADIVVSRAGANVICELLAMNKPNLLIPLPAGASRGDQILNAASFKKQGYSEVLEEDNLTNDTLLNAINDLYDNREQYIKTMQSSTLNDAINIIMNLIEETISTN
jgi:UDP-N-acetylglucosamine--N-acetylmuramyl-(pentapeptide) pyrophosphoryl-undecaprenol N-acetylglucosamine transferase